MVRRMAVLLLLLAVVVFAGCVMPGYGSVMAPIMEIKSPLAVGDQTISAAKVGESTAEGIILLARGDASIDTAMKNGGITKIHHVDTEQFNVLNIYVRQTTRVYGE